MSFEVQNLTNNCVQSLHVAERPYEDNLIFYTKLCSQH